MKNITVTVSDELYRAARAKAAAEGTTLSAFVRKDLESYVQEGQLTPWGQRFIETVERIKAERHAAGEGPLSSKDNLTREELYNERFRRHEPSDLQRD